jgi:hypothetical protein
MGLDRKYRRLLHAARLSEGKPAARPWEHAKLQASRRRHALMLIDFEKLCDRHELDTEVRLSVRRALAGVTVDSGDQAGTGPSHNAVGSSDENRFRR